MALKYCFIPTCTNNSIVNDKKIFIRIPANVIRRRKWYLAVFPGMTDKDIPKTSMVYCCEDHFDMEKDSENWMAYKTIATALKMKKDAIPHINLVHNQNSKEVSQISLSAQKRKRETIEGFHSRRKLFGDSVEASTGEASKLASTSESPTRLCQRDDEFSTCASPSGKFHIIENYFTKLIEEEPDTNSIGIQATQDQCVQTNVKLKQFCNIPSTYSSAENTNSIGIQATQETRDQCVQTNLKLKQFCNVPSKYSSAEEYMSSSSTDSSEIYEPSSSSDSFKPEGYKGREMINNLSNTIIKIENHSRFYLGIPEKEYFLIKLLTEEVGISYEHVLITIKKIRLNDAYFRLGIDFGYSISRIGHIFVNSVPRIANVLQNFIYWPDENVIKMNLPTTFMTRYKTVQSVIDCLEIQIEQPSNATHQAQTWSSYKKCNTIKYLISSTPFGSINYISVGYGGRTSDKEIIKDSGFVDQLPNNCSVMADRGFKNVEHLLANKKCHLVRPPSVSADEKMTKEKVMESRKIAALRIHIERVIRRIREFEMLKPHACVNIKLVALLDYIIIIACGIINVQGPLNK